jgi:negative regulator of sigma E activity
VAKDMEKILEKIDLSEESREYKAALTSYDIDPVELLKSIHKRIDDKVADRLTESSAKK